MKRFAKKITFFGVTVALIFIIYARIFIGGEDDNFYRRFTSPPAPSLVVGSSRCAQGIVPSILNESAVNFERPLYNYCFTNGNSPYGPSYLESIQKKLKESGNGLFLVEVNPWVLSVTDSTVEEGEFREADRFIGEVEIVNYMNPNLEYIAKRYRRDHYETILLDVQGIETRSFLNENGWLKVDVSMDSSDVKRRIEGKIESYRELADEWQLSETRLRYLKKTLSYLNKHGRVFVIRMPTSNQMKAVEEKYAPQFDHKVRSIATETRAIYLDFFSSNGGYRTTDGNHLWREDSRRFTQTLVDVLR